MLLRTAHGSYEVHTMLCRLHRVVQLGLGTVCRLSIHPQSLSRTSHLGVVQVITHHYSVLKEQEIRGSSVLLDLSQGSGWSCGSSDRDQLWELKLVFIHHVLLLLSMNQTLLTTKGMVCSLYSIIHEHIDNLQR